MRKGRVLASRKLVIMRFGVETNNDGDLPHLTDALRRTRGFFRERESRKQQRCEHGDDRDHHQQFNQREPAEA